MNERLNKILAKSGICSRRKADELISAGKVKLNGQTVTALGTQADITKDKILFNGKLLITEKKIYVLLHKPVGYTTTIKDPHAEKLITELFPDIPERLFPVGRLDKDTSGLLILTNDGNLSFKLTHPKFEINRIYEVKVQKGLSAQTIKKIEAGGLEIEDYVTSKCKIKVRSRTKANTDLVITLTEGRKREIRKMFSLFGHPVINLKRIRFGKLELGSLQVGKWRYLKRSEII
ncbi:MAG: rRNA pseudouridine synthase [Candidatus Omnitrophica bacterium]|nr:rRNA pseudouridine synthase [Candidatus Omnitrophota bacterium]